MKIIPPPNDLEQRLITIRRHLNGLTMAFEALEAEILHQNIEPLSEAEAAARHAQNVAYQAGPSEVKIIRD